MIYLMECAAEIETLKPVICPKCNRGKIGNIPTWSKMILSKRGKPPPRIRFNGVQVKCGKCKTLWKVTIK